MFHYNLYVDIVIFQNLMRMRIKTTQNVYILWAWSYHIQFWRFIQCAYTENPEVYHIIMTCKIILPRVLKNVANGDCIDQRLDLIVPEHCVKHWVVYNNMYVDVWTHNKKNERLTQGMNTHS